MSTRLLVGILIALLIGLSFAAAPVAFASPEKVHDFLCENCHAPGADPLVLGHAVTNLCLKCHKDSPLSVEEHSTAIATPTGLFNVNDAANANNSATLAGMAPAPTEQTSHYWASTVDTVPSMGAEPATSVLYQSPYDISTGRVTCSLCHDPHLFPSRNLLRFDFGNDAICLNCHRPWNQSNNNGLETHPMVADYAAVAAAEPAKYEAGFDAGTGVLDANVGQGGVLLVKDDVTGKHKVSCNSCHAPHWVDSDSSTLDGKGNQAGLNAGDGKLLRSDGPLRTGATPADTAQLRSNLCQACHSYKAHGNEFAADHGATGPDPIKIGCLDCHSGHSYNGGIPNYYVLRDQVDTYIPMNASAQGVLGGLDYTDITGATKDTKNERWVDGGAGYCEKCHGDVSTFQGKVHLATDDCTGCHNHSGNLFSFQADCGSCHGYPPAAGTEAAGYGRTEETLHNLHATDKNIACTICHNGFGQPTDSHNNGTFDDVFLGGDPLDTLVTDGGALAPAYAADTCSAFYCHSNGSPRVGSVQTGSPTWFGAAPLGCDGCHGDSSAAMNTKSNSPAHEQHVAKYSCSVCHSGTVDSGGSLTGGGLHVSGAADVLFDAAADLGADVLGPGGVYAADGTCSNIYCHDPTASGNIPDWDAAATWDGASSAVCGSCHDVSGASIGGSHPKHVSDAGFACDSCHGAGADSAAHLGHVDGVGSLDISCSNLYCHSNVQSAGGTAAADTFASPVWGVPASGDCDSCHGQASLTTGLPSSGSHAVHPFACATCHQGAGSGSTIHADNSIDLAFAPAVDLGSAAYSLGANTAPGDGFGTCSNISCHNGTQTPTWGASGSCGSCHGNGGGEPWPAVGAHDAHFAAMGIVGLSDAAAQSRCDYCHNGYGSGSASHADGNKYQISFGGAFDDKSAGTPAYSGGADGSCSDLSCHGGQTTPLWSGTIDLGLTGTAQRTECLKCHALGTGEYNGLDSGKHLAHVDSGRADLACDDCHGSQPSGHLLDTNLLSSAMLNPDNIAPDAQGTFGAPGTYTDITPAGYAAGGNSGSCSTFACHGNNNWDPTTGGGCNFCHGDTGSGRYWPTGGASLPDRAGRHEKHIEALAARDGLSVAALLADADTDNKQKGLCAFCHTDPGGAGHNAYVQAETTFRPAWDVAAAAAGDYDSTETNSCSNIACHKGKATGSSTEGTNITTFGWLTDAGTSTCDMCHVDVPNDGAHTTHTGSLVSTIDCDKCHVSGIIWGTTAPSTGHIDGSLDVGGDVSLTYSAGSCGTNQCHNDGTGAAPAFGAYAWGGDVQADSGCLECHGPALTTNGHQAHLEAHQTGITPGVFVGSALVCGNCHAAETAATHMDGNVTVPAEGYNGDLVATVASGYGQCATSACHQSGVGTTYVDSPMWDRLIDSSDDCTVCHGLAPSSGSHAKHVAASGLPHSYINTGDATAPADYAFACDNCHGNAIANHLDSSVTVDTVGLTYGGGTCSSAACHVDGVGGGGSFVPTPIWGSVPADSCAICHGNSPASGSHDAHSIGIHTKNTFDGVSGLIPESGSDPVHGGRYGVENEKVTSTVINCQICHNDTVKDWYNDSNAECAACHNGTDEALKGNVNIADKTVHLDGNVDVVFMNAPLRTKAQLRNDIRDTPEVDGSWQRMESGFLMELIYKQVYSYDETKNPIAAGTYDGAGNCSNIACHNSKPATWGDATATCTSCHTELP